MSSESDRVMVPSDAIGRVDSDTESEGEGEEGPEEVVEKFREVYETLYIGVGYVEAMNLIGPDSLNPDSDCSGL